MNAIYVNWAVFERAELTLFKRLLASEDRNVAMPEEEGE